MRVWRRLAGGAVLVLALAAGSIAISLWVTPMQQVSAAGQTVRVGVTAPSWSLSGPGELDLFGESIATTLDFTGPVRPRLALSHITLSEELSQLTAGSPGGGARALEDALVSGWKRFFVWQFAVAGLISVLLFGAVAGWLRRGVKATAVLVLLGVVVTEAADAGAIMVTAYTAPAKLRQVRSLQDLVGGAPPPTLPAARGDASTVRNVVVIGDSTAAGQGNRPLPNATAGDQVCQRSADAFAVDIANATRWTVTNVACSGATIRSGLLGPQIVGSHTEPPQLASDKVAMADVIIVSIGANDLHWSALLRLCAVSQSCSNKAEQAYFQQQLAGFSRDYLQLLSQLQLLRSHPVVVVNGYYDPFPNDIRCLSSVGMTSAKKQSLEGDLSAMNDILRNGADAAGFLSAVPNFSGHGVCAQEPYVQGVGAPAPFHPSSSGELAIALADEHALEGR